VFLGIDGVDGGLSISSEQGYKALHLGLGVAYEAGAHLVIRRLSRANDAATKVSSGKSCVAKLIRASCRSISSLQP
jgi:hypothetical protein